VKDCKANEKKTHEIGQCVVSLDTQENDQPPGEPNISISSTSEYSTLPKNTLDFKTWCNEYVRTKCGELSESTIRQSASFVSNMDQSHIPFFDSLDFGDFLDCYTDTKQNEISPSSLTNHFRYIRLMLLWKFSNGHCHRSLLDVIDEHLAGYQKFASRRDHHTNLLNFLSPHRLIEIREMVVTALRQDQLNHIDPLITRILRNNNVKGIELTTFSKRLRNWLELCFRFVDIPLRIQCSICMELKNTETIASEYNFLSKLEKLPSGYTRIIVRDKVQQSHQPVQLNVPDVLNPYLHFYLVFCRPALTTSSNYVFPSGSGGKWVHASKQLKEYLDIELGINPNELEPSGRFIHCTRKIALAAFGTRVQFNVDKLRGFAKLMRHSLATSEKYYCHWSDTTLSQNAVKEWSYCMLGQEDRLPDTPYVPGNIRTPPDILSKWYRETYSFYDKNVQFTLRDSSTQTDFSDDDQPFVDNLQHTKSTMPACSLCSRKFSVFGPLGLRRDKNYGRYFAQCLQCDGKRPGTRTVWYTEGVDVPERSLSNQPRTKKQKTYCSNV
jgi:hypothetical protein